VGEDGPVLLGHEGPDLALAVADELERDRLHAPRGEAAADLLPEDGAHLVADEPVEDAPCLLGVDLLGVELARVLEGLLDRALRDLVEDHPPELLPRASAELVGEMPADRLALAVGVGGEEDRGRFLGRRLQLVEDLLAGLEDLVLGLEALLDVHAELLLREVADVAHRGLDRVVAAQVLVDRLRLRGRLDDDQVLRQMRAQFLT
jgi:hypothetical protein